MKKIMFAGPSGIGKTTLMKFINETYCPVEDFPIISGSVSDLLPNTKDMLHQDMLSRDVNELYKEDFQILNIRKKIFSVDHGFVSDRSYLDSAAYFLLKHSASSPKCEVEHFLELCKMLLNQQCTHLIVLPYNPNMIGDFVIEDNNKRITSPYFQAHITSLFRLSLELFNFIDVQEIYSIKEGIMKHTYLKYGAVIGDITSCYGKTNVIIINEPGIVERKKLINYFLSL